MEARDALERLGGMSTAGPIVAASSRRKLRTAVARGEVVRVGRDRYALPTRRAGRALVATHGGHLSHLSAAGARGWPRWRQPERPQLILAPGASPRVGGAVEVRRAHLPRADRDGWSTSAVRTVLDCARDLPFADALAVGDAALRAGAVDRTTLLQAASAVGLEGQARVVIEWADPRPANPFESALRALAVEAGLAVVPQYEVRVGGLLLHPDLADPLAGIAVEAESWTFHGGKDDHDRDCVRFNALMAAGWRVLRFTWEHVRFSPDYVLTTLRAAARAA